MVSYHDIGFHINGDKIILTDKEILKHDKIEISSIDQNQIQPASIDLRLDNEIKRPINKGGVNRISDDMTLKNEKKDLIDIEQNEFLLASTKEYINIPSNVAAYIEGRSSIGRKGLFVENAGWIDPGFEGKITLELFNASNRTVNVPANIRICQIVFEELNEEVSVPYGNKSYSKYQGQDKVTESRIEEDIEFG